MFLTSIDSDLLLTLMLMESLVKFRSSQNISEASQQNSIPPQQLKEMGTFFFLLFKEKTSRGSISFWKPRDTKLILENLFTPF